MANQDYIKPGGQVGYREATGAGTDLDPFQPYFLNKGVGDKADTPADKPTLLATPVTEYSVVALLKALTLGDVHNHEPTGVTGVTVNDTYAASGEITIDCADWQYLSIWIQNTGANAIESIKLEGALTSLDKWVLLAETAANYGAESGKTTNNLLVPLVDASGLPAIASSGEGWAQVWVGSLDRVRVFCRTTTSSGDTTTVQIDGKLFR